MVKNQEKQLSIWQERLRKNMAVMECQYQQMENRAALYDGTRMVARDPNSTSKKKSNQASMVRNICAELIEAQVDSSIPMPKVTARRKEDEQRARILEDYLKNEVDRLPFEMLNDMDERISPVQGGDMFLVEWDAERHTHTSRGELTVSILHPRQVVFQDGVNDINDMDFIIVRMGMSKNHVEEQYGISVENEMEESPQVRGGISVADDMVTVNFGYFRNKKGGIGRFTWVNDIVLEDLEDYQARRIKKCISCGQPMYGDTCEFCGSKKYEDDTPDTFRLYEDIPLSDGTILPQYKTELQPVEGLPALLTDSMGNAYQADMMEVEVVQEIPYYKPDVYPIVLRKNVSAWGKTLGDSDIDKIADQQNAIKKCDSRIQEKLDKGGSVLTKDAKTNMSYTDEQLKVVNFENISERSAFGVYNLQVDVSMDRVIADDQYNQARNILGITDSFQGRPDRTATSGTAKQIAVAQSAGRLESKRRMKNAMYADLYNVMFRFLLAYSDEPRPIRHRNIDGSTTYGMFNKFDFLAQDDAGAYYWVDDFLFSVDTSGTLASNREAMWQEIRLNYQTGAFGNVNELDTQILFWSLMASQGYPMAAEVKSQLEEKQQQQQMMQQQQQLQQMQQVQGGGANEVPVL